MGRPKRSSPFPSSSAASHRMVLGNARPRRSPDMTSGSASTDARPRCRFRTARYRPLGDSISSSSEGSAPFFLAKPTAAGVSSPAASRAAPTGGPVITSSLSVCRSATRATRTVRRRGVDHDSTGPSTSSRASRSCAAVTSASCLVKPASQLAGTSSTPISISNSRSIYRSAVGPHFSSA